MRMLVSVRHAEEAVVAAASGADFIDLKEPRAGALGGLPLSTIRDVLAALKSQRCALPTSATIGDLPMHDLSSILRQVQLVGDCGVNFVKVGILRHDAAPRVLQALANLPWPVVPVFIADDGIDFDVLAQAQGFPAVMLDTADKRRGSLFELAKPADLHRFVAQVRAQGSLVGLAGALRLHHLPQLAALAPDFAGFRSAVCEGSREASLSADLLRQLSVAIREPRCNDAAEHARASSLV